MDALRLPQQPLFDAVVGNPPWIRIHHLEANVREYARSHFETAAGMFDLSHTFIEQAIRLLKPGGSFVLLVPSAIASQPSATPLRNFLDGECVWALEPVAENPFLGKIGVNPAVLKGTKGATSCSEPTNERRSAKSACLADVAEVTTGAATGANRIFLVDGDTADRWNIEPDVLRPVVRGRDVDSSGWAIPRTQILWPYEETLEGKWSLAPLSAWPKARRYLERHRKRLTDRQRLRDQIERRPQTWYRFIDARGVRPLECTYRVVVPDIFLDPAYAILTDPRAVVLNTCFEVRPLAGQEAALQRAIAHPEFWNRLTARSRRLSNGYRRTSVAELRGLDMRGLV